MHASTIVPTPTENSTVEPWHRRSIDDVLERLAGSVDGLDPAEAATRLEQHGPNELTESAGTSKLLLIYGNPFCSVATNRRIMCTCDSK